VAKIIIAGLFYLLKSKSGKGYLLSRSSVIIKAFTKETNAGILSSLNGLKANLISSIYGELCTKPSYR
jgi:hypothetical protein